MEEFSIIKENDMCRCDICNSPEEYLLCEECFNKYNIAFEENLNNFVTTRNIISQKINNILSFNNSRSGKLNKAIIHNKFKQTIESLINQEKTKIEKYKEESKNYEQLLIKQKDKNSGLNCILKELEKGSKAPEFKNDSIDDSLVNLTNLYLEVDGGDKISNIKKEIFEMNNEIRKVKKKYVYNLFENLFIKKKSVIKISDFFENKHYQESMNFSIIKTTNNNSQINSNENNDIENDTLISKEIKINLLKEKDIYLKRFTSFVKSMFTFLEKSYNKFQLKMPFKINHYKIVYKNEFEYNCEINKSKLNDLSALNSIIKGLHLLNINYIYLIQNIFGDTIKLNDWFDISLFLTSQNDDIGSLENILEDAKNDNNEEEFNGFVVIDD